MLPGPDTTPGTKLAGAATELQAWFFWEKQNRATARRVPSPEPAEQTNVRRRPRQPRRQPLPFPLPFDGDEPSRDDRRRGQDR
ncbi:MAG: hypothetical protein RLZZ458_3304 [Planctomycetota bacterium]|jgi:hypothetical protein